MHIRKKPWARPELAACPYFIADPEPHKGKWQELFKTKKALHVELGCGKGVSTAEMVYHHQDTNFVVLDLISDVLGSTRRNIAKRFSKEPIENVIITRYNVDYIEKIFSEEDEVSRIYISFCNPWSERKKHFKRRLTHSRQLQQYRKFLAENGEIWFKTDNVPLFDDSLVYFKENGFSIEYQTRNLQESGFTPNYISEHEAKFMSQGIPINFVIAKKQKMD